MTSPSSNWSGDRTKPELRARATTRSPSSTRRPAIRSAAIASADHSRHLSPFDPLLFGMLGARAMALVRLARFEEAADWAVKAAARPNAHAHILGYPAFCLALAGRLDEARAYVASIHKTFPRLRR